MTSTRDSIVIAGAGIGGLTAAIAAAQKGFRVSLLEQAERIEEVGAGIQLSPNATRILTALGLGERLKPHVVVPQAIQVLAARSGREIVRVPLGAGAEFQYGAPYWLLHRGDLQSALLDAVAAHRDITLKLGLRLEDYTVHGKGLTVQARRGRVALDQHGIALVGADGLWSTVRARLDETRSVHERPPRFARRTAWRATIAADNAPAEMREPLVRLWLGSNAHLVHYPVRGGNAINIVAIFRDGWKGREWSAAGAREELLARFSRRRWAAPARDLLALPERWLKWALHDLAPRAQWGKGPVTLLGDAAHPMLPFLAQGAAMAIEDAGILAECLAKSSSDPARAMRHYEGMRKSRTARVQRAARSAGKTYHLMPPASLARNLAMRMMGGERLRTRYDWLYDWRCV